ncbi:MAG: excinuclease ABC subunit UvrA [Anaerolineae bacterium]|nr:excinuclease ABC subunit UvrA [Anaerolineae bacterium]
MVRDTIDVKGAKEHNLKNVDVEIPRNQLVVITGVSGSGKSSLAFDTVYAEGQRRFLESLSAYAKKFVSQLKKPNVDFVTGLSPVISIEQKTTNRNPRSTVGTMTDIYDYLRMLFATVGVAHCPYCGREVPIRSSKQMLERLLALPEETEVEIRAPVFKFYGEDYAYLLDDLRTKGYRRIYVDGQLCDASKDLDLDEAKTYQLDILVDRFVIKGDMDRQVLASLDHGLLVGEGFISLHLVTLLTDHNGSFYADLACPEHGVVMGELEPQYFSFNLPSGSSSCVTCLGMGTYRQVHPDLLVPDKSRSIKSGAFIPAAFKYDKNLWDGRIMYSLAQHYGFSLDTPFEELGADIVDILFYGNGGVRFPVVLPEGAASGEQHVGRMVSFGGIINRIERRYRRYRKEGTQHTWVEEWLKRVMVEYVCPDCGGKRLKWQRFLVTIDDETIHDVSEMPLQRLIDFLQQIPMPQKKKKAGVQIANEIVRRVRLLLDIGLDYLMLNRRADTLSGGESQRVRLSTQIGSELMGMLYVLDEPSIGLHPKDNVKMIDTLRRLRDMGNSVIVVEHDETTMRAADHIIELGPGPGLHGGKIVAQGRIDDILGDPVSLTGQYLRGARRISIPKARRSPNCKSLVVRGAQQNNLRGIDVTIPLGVFTCVTGVSGSGKSSLVHEILYKKLYSIFHDSRVLPGRHEAIEGIEYISDVIHIDQSPIGRSPRSNPATYIGIYDAIRRLFARTPQAQARGYTVSRFSFNVKQGRCEECGGEGVLRTHLQLMADVETICPVCKGARYNEETLEIVYNGKNIGEVLDMSIEEGSAFFVDQRAIHHKLHIMDELGLGYLQLGHPATHLSGGEAQRVKLAHQLGKIKHGKHNLYILDEPTTGLHLADIQRLLDSLNRLVDAGHTVVVIEHHMDVIKAADWIIDLGPEGGDAGGRIVAQGAPEQIAQVPTSYTGRYLKRILI